MHILAWHPPPLQRLPEQAQVQAALELAPPPPGFGTADDSDGSVVYRQLALPQRLRARGVRLLALRHGQALSNSQAETLGQPLLFGQTETPLTDKGRQQAHDAARKLLDELGGPSWLQSCLAEGKELPVIFCSDLTRAQETGRIIKSGWADEAHRLAGESGRSRIERELGVVADARLRETHFGQFESRPMAELRSAYPAFVETWRPSRGPAVDFRHRFPGGESRADVMRRVSELLNECCQKYPGRTVVLISHGETLLATRALLGLAPVQAGKVVAETGVISNAVPFWLCKP